MNEFDAMTHRFATNGLGDPTRLPSAHDPLRRATDGRRSDGVNQLAVSELSGRPGL